ncbi:endolytic transglycosylase MltG [Alkalibaculum sporogenes]|nr:endolytic transglycosylase MltG [Alkalibaculum sporogenes]
MIVKSRILLVVIVFSFILGSFILLYSFLLTPVNRNNEQALFEITSGKSIGDIAIDLKAQGLIKSVNAFKLHVKLHDIYNLKMGTYELTDSMSAKEIANKIQLGDVIYPNKVKITFPEGLTLLEMANILSEQMDYSTEYIINAWNHPKFLEEVISNFSYITEDIKNTGISYPLNGYLFPETYIFPNKNIPPEDVAWIMLSKMESVLSEYSYLIDNQDLSIHELLTLASIIEYEAMIDEDRPLISGVFHNRLNINMKLDSCATLQMALGVHKEIYNNLDTQIDSPYNTYLTSGLPIGPGNSPGMKSIVAALKPTKHSYYYFLSDIYGDNTVYYSETIDQHNLYKNKYLK